jgi:N-acetylglutamate synthase-like GNAT family acetyltransferase
MSITTEEVPYGSEKYKELLKLRYEVLRKPLGTELTDKDTALDDKEFHLAAVEGQTIAGCVLLRPLSPDLIKLRQMAVSDHYQGKGIGAKLVTYAEEVAAERGFKVMEMHAREFARGFYEKLGYVTEGEHFIEATVSTIKMHKSLKKYKPHL